MTRHANRSQRFEIGLELGRDWDGFRIDDHPGVYAGLWTLARLPVLTRPAR
jgi:hypothetical protein